MSISTGVKARKQHYGKKGGNRAGLKAKHSGAYVERTGIMGGRTRAQKIAARDSN